MQKRIAEFDSMCDAHDFMRLKNRDAGEDAYTVCGGIQRMWAVMPKIQYATNLGNPESEPEFHYIDQDHYDDES